MVGIDEEGWTVGENKEFVGAVISFPIKDMIEVEIIGESCMSKTKKNWIGVFDGPVGDPRPYLNVDVAFMCFFLKMLWFILVPSGFWGR